MGRNQLKSKATPSRDVRTKTLELLRKLSQYPFFPYLWTYRRRYLIGLGALVLVDAMNVAYPLVIRHAIDAVTNQKTAAVLWAALAMFLMTAGQSLFRYCWRLFLTGTSHFIARDLRKKLYSHLQTLPLPYYQKVRTGDLMSRATNDIQAIREATGPGVLVTADALITLVLIIPAMLILSPKLTLLALILYPLVPVLTLKLGDRIDILFENLQKKLSDLSAYTQESLGAVRLLKSLVLERKTHARFSELSRVYREEGLQLAKYESVFSPSLNLLTDIGTLLILFVGGFQVIDGAITLGTFVAFQRFVVQLVWPMEAIGWAVTVNREGFAAHRRLKQVLDVEPVKSFCGKPALIRKEPSLEIQKLRFQYPNSQFTLRLDPIFIAPGRKIGIVGPVGSGKSTLFRLLLRLYEPESQSIRFGGEDIRSIPLENLRQTLASVDQQVFLFSETISDNIGLGTQTALDSQTVQWASKLSCIHNEVTELSEKYESVLGEKGVNLSGGQKQRLALARGLVRKPNFLLLDDCFSAVDVEVEHKIIENLFREFPNTGFLIASHRLSIMPQLDEVFVFQQGQVIARGDHHSLLETSRLYQSLWKTDREPKKQPSAPKELVLR